MLHELQDAQIAWAAGFLEGEGNFRRTARGTLVVRAAQVNREPLETLLGLLGGSLAEESRRTTSGSAVHVWTLTGFAARDLLLAIRPWLSSRRREQADDVLENTRRPKEVRNAA